MNAIRTLLPKGAFGGGFTSVTHVGRFSGQSQQILFSGFFAIAFSRFLISF
jgi:hypothetical protein